MSDLEGRLIAIEKRLVDAEDRLAIYQLLASYGPSADSNSSQSLQDMWLEDGTYETEQYVFRGAAEVGALIDTDMHRDFVGRGCAHVMSMPHIILHGDRAVAIGYSRVYLHDGDHWRVARASANRWHLLRTGKGWKVERRINRTLSGSADSRDLIGGAFDR